ncbi:hypothetical protein IFT48_02965 [Pseudomonas fluorescens]|uniref:hypothetical protein n=1 Tax=Pseudomonas fluorescens TaxID=294 RepID=UPI0019309A88|nr:hypothetical protein [Pseudomonas fluorescens]MBD8088928.1 hypothetical protein [Pseudomonas fluorescens]
MTMLFLGEQFRNEVTSNFSLRRLERSRQPIELGHYPLDREADLSVNNLLVKLKQTLAPVFPANLPQSVQDLITRCITDAHDSGLPVRNRFVYLTYDTRPFKKGSTQRNPGWHFDGLQGNEVMLKQPGCYSFLWTNKLPFLISDQSFSLAGLDVGQHHIFDSLATQVFEDAVTESIPEHLYLMSCYQVHRAQVAQEDVNDRLFVRITFSELAYTSTSMTLNPDIDYPFTPHSTSGEIPANLSVLRGLGAPIRDVQAL